MPITFSSFGDVATVLQLAWQLRAALSDASGASAEIRALIIDVDSFTRALQQTKAAVEQRRTPLPAIENGIKHAIIACHDALRLILRKIEAFKTRMTSRIGAAAWRQYWAVAAWSILGGKKEVDALRVRLSEQIGVVQTYLSLAQSNDQAKVQETVESQGVALDRIYTVMQDIQIRFDVGVPSFRFYDDSYGYYTPFARTSFQRLKEALVFQIEHLAIWLGDTERDAQYSACDHLRRAIYELDTAFLKRSIIPLLLLHIECQLPSLQKIQHVCETGTRKASSFVYRQGPYHTPLYTHFERREDIGTVFVWEYMSPGDTLKWL